jgi:ribonuclease HI
VGQGVNAPEIKCAIRHLVWVYRDEAGRNFEYTAGRIRFRIGTSMCRELVSLDKVKTLSIYTDGASLGNPGIAASAFVIVADDGRVISRKSRCIGVNTNNVAEYLGVLDSLQQCVWMLSREKGGTEGKEYFPVSLKVYSDSEIVVKQLRGEYRVLSSSLRKYYLEILHLCNKFVSVEFIWVPRNSGLNAEAHKLCHECLEGLS